MSSSELGVYFGPETISIVQAKGGKILNSIQIPRLSSSPEGEIEEKVPDEVKTVALFKDEMRKNNISGDKVVISLSGKELIIRTFEMPLLGRDELQSAVTF
jgi:Tfp pilus assembly PilM family ATPase